MKKHTHPHDPLYPAVSSFPLNREAVKRLDTLLRVKVSPIGSVFKADGFFCALCLFRLDEEVDGMAFLCDKMVWDSPSEEAWVRQSLRALFAFRKNQMKQLVKVDYLMQFIPQKLPRLFPLVEDEPLSVFSRETLNETQKERLTDWCRGYLTALQLDEEMLLRLKEQENQELVDMMISVMALARPDASHFSEFLVYLKGYQEWDEERGEWTENPDDLVKELTLSFASTSVILLKKAYEELCRLQKRESFYSEEERATLPVVRTTVGRNAACPCGSGKKFKRCCLREGE